MQVDPGLVAPMALSLTSLAATKAFEFQGRPQHTELPPIWTVTLGTPGALKSPILRQLQSPFRRPTTCGSDRITPSISSISSEVNNSCSSEPLFEIDDDDDDDDIDVNELLRGRKKSKGNYRSGRRNSHHQQNLPPHNLGFELFAQDLTPVSAAHVCRDLGERLGIVSDEGHFIAHVQRAIFGGGVDLFLKGWGGDSFILRRVKENLTLHAPEIVVALLIQPGIVGDLLGTKSLVERGIPQRFLYSAPPISSVSHSYGDAVELPIHLAAAWDNRIRGLLAIPRNNVTPKSILTLTPDARIRYNAAATRLLEERGNDAHSPLMREWFAKAHGQCLRIAGILAVLGSDHPTAIGVDEISAAEAWLAYFSAHTGAIFIAEGADDRVHFHARRVTAWLKFLGQSWVSRNSVTQALRCRDLPKKSDWDPVFALLEEGHYLRQTPPITNPGRGGRPSPGYMVNPLIITDGRS